MSYMSEYDALDDPATAPEALDARPGKRSRLAAEGVWLVLARKGYEEPLRQVGAVEADDPDLARVYARSIYDEFAWIEMVIVPRRAAITVIAS
ncbi:MAG TPA: hypothetical protein VF808_16855 [Ktedonobacterales bacterium]